MEGVDLTSVTCPWCQEKLRLDPLNVLTLNTSEEVKAKLLAGEYDNFPCPTCGRDIPYSNPILCHDILNHILIYYFPNPPPEDMRETIQSVLRRIIRKASLQGIPSPPDDDWKVRIAFGRDELKAAFTGQMDEE